MMSTAFARTRAAAVLHERGRTLRQELRGRPRLRNILLAMLVALLVVPLHGRTGVRIVEARVFDILATIAPPQPAEPGAIIVAIDEPSFAELSERWPWPRDLHARLVTSLKQAGARTIGLDIVFAEPSSAEADAALAAALGPGQVLAADREVITLDHGTQVSRIGPLPALIANGAQSGVTSVDLDSDGVLRRLPMVADSFAAALLQAGGEAVPAPQARPLLQYFGGARSYPTVSYYQALDPAAFLPPGVFKDKTVLVGLSLKAAPTAASGGTDAFETPFTVKTGTMTAGVEVHATILDNLRHGLWIAPAPLSAIALAVVICALLGCGSGSGAITWRTGAIAATSLIVILAASWLLLRFGRIWLPPVTPVLAAVSGFGARFGLDYARERRLRAAVSEAFSRYVSPALVSELARNPDSLKLGGERRELSVLFCDVRGFTSLSERLKDDPVRLTNIINRLLDALSEQVLEARGTIDKYMGDCVMAFWNAPLPEPCHAQAAVTAALEMSRAVERLNVELQAEDPLLPPLAVGVGVNTGMCVVGNIGSRWRYDYSVLGDTVNLASRLEGLTKDYAVPVILGEGTARAIDDHFLVFELDRIAVRGRSEATPIFTVLGPASQRETAAGQALLSAQELLWTGLAQGDAELCLAALDAIPEAHEGLTGYASKMRAILTMRRVDAAACMSMTRDIKAGAPEVF
jgi:adenylate cyclase